MNEESCVSGGGVWKGMPVLCAAVFINALCVHQCLSLRLCALLAMCTHREVATRLTWTGPSCMETWTPTALTSRCVRLCVFVLPLLTQAALFVIAQSRDRGIACIRGALRDMLHASFLLFSLDDALCVVRAVHPHPSGSQHSRLRTVSRHLPRGECLLWVHGCCWLCSYRFCRGVEG